MKVNREAIAGMLIVAIMFMCVPSVAASSTVVSIQDASASIGETVKVPINITDVTNLCGASIWLSYDKAVVTVEKVDSGDLGTVTSNIDNTNCVTKMVWDATDGMTGSFVFAYITLKAVGKGTSPLDLDVRDLYDCDLGDIERSISDGTFTVGYELGCIEGYINNTDENPIEGATVSATGTGSGSDETDGSGYYMIPDLSPGRYSVTASRAGYNHQTRDGVDVVADGCTRLDFVLTGREEDIYPPSVIDPIATPDAIDAEGVQTSELSVTVTDPSGVLSVAIDLSLIGGSPTQPMILVTGDLYTTTTTAAVGTVPDTYCLAVNATDNIGNSNTTECIELTVMPPPPPDMVYLNPEHSSAPFCDTAEVGIWVNATRFQGGQMSITYPTSCANVTEWTRNGDDFPMGTSTHASGSVWITFVAPCSLTGSYMVGTLTIHCVGELGCTAPLTFVEPSLLSNSHGQAIEVDWMDGTFTCVGLCGDVAPYPEGDGIIDMRDVVLLLNYIGYPGMYPLCEWCGDVAPCPAGDGIIDIRDVTLLLNHVGDPDSYPLCCNER